MADPYSSVSISGYNTNPPADDGSQTEANRVKWATIKTKLNDPVKTRTDDMDAEIASAFGKVIGGGGVTSTAISYSVLSTDQGKLVRATNSGVTITTPDATDVDAPFVFAVLNNSSGNITLDGNGSQTIDGSADVTITSGAGLIVFTDGTNWFTTGKNFFQAGSGIAIDATTSPPTLSAPLYNYLGGLELSTAGSSATMSIAAGQASDSTNAALMGLAAAISKTTSSWAVGSGSGGIDTGAIATNTWYHFFLIKRTDTGVVDVLFSLSASSPTMPANYTLKRRIGSGRTNGSSQWTSFRQTGDKFEWLTQVVDVAGATPANGNQNTVTLTVPTGVSVEAIIHAGVIYSSGNALQLWIWSTFLSAKPSIQNATGFSALNSQPNMFSTRITTDTSAQVFTMIAFSAGTPSYSVETEGWIDRRGK